MENEGLPLQMTPSKIQYQSMSKIEENEEKLIPSKIENKKDVFRKCKLVCVSASIFALIGLVLMIAEVELRLFHIYPHSKTEAIIGTVMSVTTIILIGLMIWFHILQKKLAMEDFGVKKLSVVISYKNRFLIVMELLLYIIHPSPCMLICKIWEKSISYENCTSMANISSFIMFFRLILVIRIILIYNPLYTHVAMQSIGAPIQINFNFKFLVRSLMSNTPEVFLFSVITCNLLITSYIFRACEIDNEGLQQCYFNSIWVMIITFLTIGYGDIYTVTTCGRLVGIWTGIFGVGCTALIIAVLANSQELSTSEKYFVRFLGQNEKDLSQKHAAARMIQFAWRSHRHRKDEKTSIADKYQNLLLRQIIMKNKKTQSHDDYSDTAIDLDRIYQTNMSMNKNIDRIQKDYKALNENVDNINETMRQIGNKMDKLEQRWTRYRISSPVTANKNGGCLPVRSWSTGDYS